MRRNPADWSSITLANDLTLLLGWRPGPKKLTAERLETNSDVADELRGLCRTTLDRLGTLAARPYEEPSILEKGEEFFTLDLEELAFTPQLRSRDTIPLTVAYTDKERDEEQGQVADLINLIQRAATLEPLSAGQARDGRFLFYAVVTADENGSPITFVKQSSRIRVARPGRLVAIYADRLSRVEQPVFAFSDDFDLVLAGTDLAVLRAEAYLSLFTDIEVLRNAVPGLVSRLSQQINIDIPDSSLTVLEERCALKPSFAKRLRRLAHQPWLDSVTLDALRKEMAALPGLPAGVIVEDGSLTVTEGGVGVLLGLIEQVYWVGPFDQQLRQAQAYLTVTSRGRPR